jgi:hypothetical protein
MSRAGDAHIYPLRGLDYAQYSSASMTILPNDYIINKKYKNLVKDILSYSELPSYFLSIDFIIYLGKINNLLKKLRLSPTEYDYFETFKSLFFVKDPTTKKVVHIPLTPIEDISNKILDVLFELVELLKISCSKETENMLLSLVPNNCEILFKILSNLDVIDCLDIHFLFNNYHYLLRNNIELIQNKFSLNNDITEEINKQLIKQVVKEDIRTLLFIPDHQLSYDIIEYAVQNNGFALKHIKPILFFKKYKYSKKNITNIIKYAVQNNGLSLQYIKSIFLLFSNKYKYSKQIITNIIELAVQNNSLALEFVDKEYLTDEIIQLAVNNNGLALQFVHEKYLTYKIIELAVQNNSCALQYVNEEIDEEKMTDEEYYEICKLAVQNNGRVLQYVDEEKMTDEEYYEICKLAVQNC